MVGPRGYKRVLVKLSGESFCQPGGSGIDAESVAAVVQEIALVIKRGVQVALVVGGGNFLRGRDLAAVPEVEPATADYMGMMATVMNAIALRDVMESRGLAARTMSAISMPAVCEPFIRHRALRHLETGRAVILAAGTGSPFFTTDTCAALRAIELKAEVLMKATKVNGVFDADPVLHPKAKRYRRLSYQQVLADRLAIMDLTAISLCMEKKMPLLVFALGRKGNLDRAVRGLNIGTLICE